MNKLERLGIALIAFAAGCASLQWTGYPDRLRDAKSQSAPEETFAVEVSTRPPKRRAAEYLPKELSAMQKDALYYSDLGLDSIDVSGYPVVQRENYEVYVRLCSQCHPLARSINAPVVSRAFWEFYILGMRFSARHHPGAQLPKSELDAVIEFLEYDSHQRKILRRAEFEELTDELKRRFKPLVDQRIRESKQRP